jgi:hypothetical protein
MITLINEEMLAEPETIGNGGLKVAFGNHVSASCLVQSARQTARWRLRNVHYLSQLENVDTLTVPHSHAIENLC